MICVYKGKKKNQNIAYLMVLFLENNKRRYFLISKWPQKKGKFLKIIFLLNLARNPTLPRDIMITLGVYFIYFGGNIAIIFLVIKLIK